ncbi:Ger(x)C family spore germination protein [Clostridium sp. YIM B02505]|uniref:Ger(X)C family spore germination protein n=1 Tax=Clostridium yunnanense TaxID=2800325 RepID=A0ABS1ESN5_9CLOT|nr:Ger(x)C family spore germination protein [Clostridium yunnanense]MBK1812345.1 Ger(x)C family spore germination protein [Clostridium yunnanense]
MRKIIFIFLICAISSSILSGCFDSNEVTEFAYVHSVGLEKGVADKLRLTVQLTSSDKNSNNSANEGGITSSQKGDILILSVDCPTFFNGINMINSYISRELTFNHTNLMIFSEELAKEGIDPYVNGIIRKREVRRDTYCAVTKGSARKFLENNIPVTTHSLSKMEEGLMFQSKKSGYFPIATYRDLIDEIKSPIEQPLLPLGSTNNGENFHEINGFDNSNFSSGGSYYAGQLPRKGGTPTEFFGSAIFDGGKMVGELTGDETRALLMIRNEFERGFFFIQDPIEEKKVVALNIRPQKPPKIKVNMKDDRPIINLKIFLEGDINSIQSTIDYDSNKLRPLIEDAFKVSIKNQIDKTIEKCQLLKTDVFRFGSYASTQFSTIQDFEDYHWLKKFKDSEVHTEVEFVIRRNGTKIYNSEILSSEKSN